MTNVRRTGRWTWAIGVAIGLAAIGLLLQEFVLVLAATIPLWYVAATGMTGLSVPPLHVERSIGHDATAPGEHVPVELSITNEGTEPLTDFRIVDGVPDELPVTDGTPRACFSLEPDETVTLSYTVSARRGEFEFDDPAIRIRNLTGEIVATIEPAWATPEPTAEQPTPTTAAADATPERTSAVAADGGTTVADGTATMSGDRSLSCTLPVEDVPLSGQSLERVGDIETDEAGAGTQFHSVREYQRGDSRRSIDWRRYARTGELTTVEYHEDRSTTAVVVIDARDETFVSANPADPAAITLSTFAAERTFDTLVAAGHTTGLSVLTDGAPQLIGPGSGPGLLHEAHERIETIRDRSPRWISLNRSDTETAASQTASNLAAKLPDEAQLVVFTPALDDYVSTVVRHLTAWGHDMTVVSPDVTTAPKPSQRLLAAERKQRLTDLRGFGATVVDWDRDRPLQLVLADALEWGDRA